MSTLRNRNRARWAALAATQMTAQADVAPKRTVTSSPAGKAATSAAGKPKRATRPAASTSATIAPGVTMPRMADPTPKLDAADVRASADSKLIAFKVTESGPTVQVPPSGTPAPADSEPTLAELEKLTAPAPKP